MLPSGNLTIFNIAMENDPFIVDLPIYLLKMVIFQFAMLNYQRVIMSRDFLSCAEESLLREELRHQSDRTAVRW